MVVRYAFGFYVGRYETLRDAATLRRARAAYVDSRGRLKSLVGSLLSSDSFLYGSRELRCDRSVPPRRLVSNESSAHRGDTSRGKVRP